MNIEIYKPINTKEKVDKIINIIKSNKELKDTYANIIIHIQKVKIQLYFKEQFDKLESVLYCNKSPHKSFKFDTNSQPNQNKKILRKENKKNKRVNQTLKSEPNNKTYIETIIIKDKSLSPDFFAGMSIKQLSETVNMPLTTLTSIIKQKGKSSVDFTDDYILPENILRDCFEFLQNAYNIMLRKDKKQTAFEKEIETAGYYRKKMEDRFKPSLGQEGNYRKLIYIPTKQ